MTGRVNRRKGLAEAAALAARATAEAAALEHGCALCGRVLGARVEWHHVVPRSEGGRATVPLHPICHRAIHVALANAELARLETIAAVRDVPEVARFVAGVAAKPAAVHAPPRRQR